MSVSKQILFYPLTDISYGRTGLRPGWPSKDDMSLAGPALIGPLWTGVERPGTTRPGLARNGPVRCAADSAGAPSALLWLSSLQLRQSVPEPARRTAARNPCAVRRAEQAQRPHRDR